MLLPFIDMLSGLGRSGVVGVFNDSVDAICVLAEVSQGLHRDLCDCAGGRRGWFVFQIVVVVVDVVE